MKRKVKGLPRTLAQPYSIRLPFGSMVKKIYTMHHLPKYNVLHAYLTHKMKLRPKNAFKLE